MLTSEWTRIQQLPDVILLRSLVTGQPGTYGSSPVSKFYKIIPMYNRHPYFLIMQSIDI